MRLSCIIPAYNEAARIGAVLDAVLGHPWIDEVIVVDDGSTDQTARVWGSAAGRIGSTSPGSPISTLKSPL
jgi:cellulose synthase/poly-beta-1,6-N-acetylglucosamine synthase-like glycosyltransferase